MALDGGPVAPGHRTGEGGGGAQLGHVVEGDPHQVEVGLEGHAGAGGDPLDLTEQGDQVVRGDRRGGVVGGPVGVGDGERAAPEVGDQRLDQRQGLGRVAGHREPGPGAQPAGADLGVGQRHERVHGGPARVRRQHVEAERAGQVGDDRASPPGSTAAATSAIAASGVAITSRSTPSAAPATVVAAAHRLGDRPADRGQGRRRGPSRPGPARRPAASAGRRRSSRPGVERADEVDAALGLVGASRGPPRRGRCRRAGPSRTGAGASGGAAPGGRARRR